MFQLITASTAAIAGRRRLSFWNEITSDALTEQCAEADDPASFIGCVPRLDLGALRIAELSASASRVNRTKRHIAAAKEAPYVMRLVLAGEMAGTQGGTTVRQRTGDFALFDTSRPYRLTLPTQVTLLSIRIPQERVFRYFSCPEAVLGKVLSGTSDTGRIALRFIRDLWSDSGAALLGATAPRLADIALQIIASCYAALPESEGTETRLLLRHRVSMTAYIDEHLHEPTLSPALVAESHGISPRYVHKIFSGSGESVSRLILKRRLDRCRALFDDHLQHSRSVTDVALAAGFDNMAHFSRSFRSRFGLAPRDYRRKASERHRDALRNLASGESRGKT